MQRFKITHTTTYQYEASVSLCYNEGQLLPRSCDLPLFHQQCLAATLKAEPNWDDQRERLDFFGNRVTYFTLRQPHEKMALTANSEVVVTPTFATGTSSDFILAQLSSQVGHLTWEEAAARLHEIGNADSDEQLMDAQQFVLPSPFVTVFPEVRDFAQPSFPPQRPLIEAVAGLMQRIYHEFDFVAGTTTIATPLLEILEKRKGVCQDFAHLMLACLRSQGLAARYMSGYIETLPAPGKEKLTGTDASHAWCAIFVPGLGWVDFDPTNNLIPQEQHVVLGWGRDFSDVTPLKGVFFGDGRHTLSVAVDMQRVA